MFQFSLKRLMLAVACFAAACWSWQGVARFLHPPLSGKLALVSISGDWLIGCAFASAGAGALAGRVWIGVVSFVVLVVSGNFVLPLLLG